SCTPNGQVRPPRLLGSTRNSADKEWLIECTIESLDASEPDVAHQFKNGTCWYSQIRRLHLDDPCRVIVHGSNPQSDLVRCSSPVPLLLREDSASLPLALAIGPVLDRSGGRRVAVVANRNHDRATRLHTTLELFERLTNLRQRQKVG